MRYLMTRILGVNITRKSNNVTQASGSLDERCASTGPIYGGLRVDVTLSMGL
jgi:hypothetical protein